MLELATVQYLQKWPPLVANFLALWWIVRWCKKELFIFEKYGMIKIFYCVGLEEKVLLVHSDFQIFRHPWFMGVNAKIKETDEST